MEQMKQIENYIKYLNNSLPNRKYFLITSLLDNMYSIAYESPEMPYEYRIFYQSSSLNVIEQVLEKFVETQKKFEEQLKNEKN